MGEIIRARTVTWFALYKLRSPLGCSVAVTLTDQPNLSESDPGINANGRRFESAQLIVGSQSLLRRVCSLCGGTATGQSVRQSRTANNAPQAGAAIPPLRMMSRPPTTSGTGIPPSRARRLNTPSQ